MERAVPFFGGDRGEIEGDTRKEEVEKKFDIRQELKNLRLMQAKTVTKALNIVKKIK
jgi:hypothetical protein